MAILIAQFIGLAAVIFVAGAVLSFCADQIAEITGFGRLLVGSILLAGATSLPELTVDITAVRLGMTDLAAGDLLGSCIMNLLILAVCDLTHYSRGKMLSREAAAHALSGTLSVAMTALVGVFILASTKLPAAQFLEISLPSWILLAVYVGGVRVVFLDQRIAAAAQMPPENQPNHHKIPLWKPSLGFLLATLALIITGPMLAETAGELAEVSGLGKTFVGTTLVAFSTSLPELVSSIAALRMKAFDLAIGNVFGSNAFNMLLFVPLDALQAGPIFSAVSATHVTTALAVNAATSIAIMGQLYRVESRSKFFEPDAWLVILVVIGALAVVYQLG